LSQSPNGLNYNIVEEYTGNKSDWDANKIDLSDYIGHQIWIGFLCDTDGSVAYDGWYIEDIKVTTNASTVFTDTADNFANWDNIGFSVVQQDFFYYPEIGTTGAYGNYSISGLGSSVNLNSWLKGSFVGVNNNSGDDAHHNVIITTPNTHDWNWSNDDTSYNKEQSNVYYHANRVHDFFTKGSPFDLNSMNYKTIAYVQYPGTCNAFSDGTNVYFYGKGGGCEATSLFSDIIYHEYTHIVVAHVYTTTLPYRGESGALNEGWADYFATVINGNPCMDDIEGGVCMRNLTDIYRYPEDIEGEVHADSRIVSGASWDLKQVLGSDIANALVINAMKLEPFNFSEYLEDIIVADDNNGNLVDGTPHLFEICTAFYQNHGIYSTYCNKYYPVEPTLSITNVTITPMTPSVGNEINITVTINNPDVSFNGRVEGNVWSPSGTGKYLGWENVVIPSGASTVTIIGPAGGAESSYITHQAGTYLYDVFLENVDDGEVYLNPTDSRLGVPFSVGAGANVYMSNVALSASPTNGSVMTLNVTISNPTASAFTGTMDANIWDSARGYVLTPQSISIAAGDSTTLIFSYTPVNHGLHSYDFFMLSPGQNTKAPWGFPCMDYAAGIGFNVV